MPCVCLGNADDVADRVSRLDQNDLPEMYQAGPCMDGMDGMDGSGGSSLQPAHLLTLLTTLLAFVFILGTFSI